MDDDRADERARLLDDVAAEFVVTASSTGIDAMPAALRRAMATVPRHVFVPEHLQRFAYDDRPLPIGHGQTISQPFIVALMTALLELSPGDRVLEIGTGCGYQTAVLASLAARVTTVELLPQLSTRAAATLAALGVHNVELQVADGHAGWPAGAPYDAIIATAAPAALPAAWIGQLAPGGRLVAPVGEVGEVQQLLRLRRGADGRIDRQALLPVRFVPLVARRD